MSFSFIKTQVLSTVFFLISCLMISQSDPNAISEIVERTAKSNHFSGTILVAENGKSIYQKSFGFSDYEEQILNESTTRYGIASVTKMMTAIIIMQLVDEGKLSTKDNLSDLLPELELQGTEKITVHHLLLHISGLPNEKDEIYAKQYSPQEFVKEVSKKMKKLKSFGEFNYANIDYVLLGLIIEKTTKSSWQKQIEQRILSPYNMNNTGFLAYQNLPDNFAFPYSLNSKDQFVRDDEFFIENFYAAGCMYSTSDDLLKLDQALYSEKFLSSEAKETMFTSYPEYNYTGYSVWTYNYPMAETQPLVMERRGGIMGANSVLVRFLDTNKTIIILNNNGTFDSDTFGDTSNLKEALMIELGKK